MLSDINERILVAEQGIERFKKITSIQKQLELELLIVLNKEKVLRNTLEKENIDVEKLEKLSVASTFYKIIGRLDDHLYDERAEAATAQMKYEQAVLDKNEIQSKISEISSEMKQYCTCEYDYNLLLKQKREILMQENGESAQKIIDIDENINKSTINLKEIEEALRAGSRVVTCLNYAIDKLNTAENWGTWDLLGGGLISDLQKHSAIDEAKNEIPKIQKQLREFKSELTDVRIDSNIYIKIDEFSKFADFFFDGLFADWSMQSKIKQSQESLINSKNQVKQVLDKLNNIKNNEIRRMNLFETELKEKIVNA